MNEFLRRRSQVNISTMFLQQSGLEASGLDCKNWEIATLIPYLKDGNLIDLGSDGSVVLANAVNLNLKGRKVGVDIIYDGDKITEDGVELYKRDAMDTGLEENSFDMVTSLSVIEHEVNFERFAKEVGRLLKIGGYAYVSFDYWNPKPEYEKRRLYNLDWNILDMNDVIGLCKCFSDNDMELTSPIDWTTEDAVINSTFCSPVESVAYSFGILQFKKK